MEDDMSKFRGMVRGAARLMAVGGVGLMLANAAAADVQTRVSAFDYDPITGLLIREIIEPDNSNQCVVTVNQYDTVGNVQLRSTRNCNGTPGTFQGDYSGSGAGVNNEAPAPSASTVDGKRASFDARTTTSLYADGFHADTTTNALQQSELHKFHPVFGTMVELIGPNKLSTKWAYDEFGRKVLEQRADGGGTKWVYEFCQTALYPEGTATCPVINGVQAVYATMTLPLFGANVDDLSAGNQSGPFVLSYTDMMGRVLRTLTQGYDGEGGPSSLIAQDTYYNAQGQVTQSSAPYSTNDAPTVWTSYQYDELGRLTLTTYPDQTTTKVERSGLLTTVTNAKKQVTKDLRNEAGLVVAITDNKGKVLRKAYDAYGSLLSTTDPAGHVVTMHYDHRGRKESMFDPDLGNWTYAYNGLGEMVQQTDAKSQKTDLGYDVLGRLISKKDATLSTQWYYETTAKKEGCGLALSNGKLCEVVSSNGSGQLSLYDELGRLRVAQTTIGASAYQFQYKYDDKSRLDTLTYPNGKSVQNVYTNQGFLSAVQDPVSKKAYWQALSVDVQGRMRLAQYGNLQYASQDFDPLMGRLTAIRLGKVPQAAELQNLQYHYDAAGLVDQSSDLVAGVTSTYVYDALNRLASDTRSVVTGSTTVTRSSAWRYDDQGNILTRTDSGGTVASSVLAYSYDKTHVHAVASVAGNVFGTNATKYVYDANGNLLSSQGIGVSRNVTWTGSNQVESLVNKGTGGLQTLAYLYDASGDRLQETWTKNGAVKSITNYLNPGAGAGLLYEEQLNAKKQAIKQKLYINVGGATIAAMEYDVVAKSWATRYWHKDRLGSIVLVTDETGKPLERMGYEPFGRRRNLDGSTARRGFTGHEMADEVGLINMNGRIYDPAVARFLSADPMIQDPSNLQSYNRYSYVWNSPLAGTDPSGYNWFSDRRNDIVKVVATISMPWAALAISNVGGLGDDVEHAWKQAYKSEIGRAVIVITASYLTAGTAEFFFAPGLFTSMASGFVGGLAGSNGHLKAGIEGALTAGAFYGVGSVTDMHNVQDWSKVSSGQFAANVLGHALVGCASAEAKGGDCGKGAASAAVGDLATPFYSANPVVGTIQSAVVGGTTSVLGGGKFSNGAITSAYGYLFNAIGAEKRKEWARANHWVDENGKLIDTSAAWRDGLADAYGKVGSVAAIAGSFPSPLAPTFQAVSLGSSVMSDIVLKPNVPGFFSDMAMDKIGGRVAEIISAPKAIMQTIVEGVKSSPQYQAAKSWMDKF
jgi:RHS repeat-associated protein